MDTAVPLTNRWGVPTPLCCDAQTSFCYSFDGLFVCADAHHTLRLALKHGDLDVAPCVGVTDYLCTLAMHGDDLPNLVLGFWYKRKSHLLSPSVSFNMPHEANAKTTM
jgi:hypothetical protein